jgi:tripartite-type tricarboxylate transporter receptor subunit TctC
MNLANVLACVLASLAAAVPAAAQEAYPVRPVTMVVPFPPGGGTDTGARAVAQKLSEKWGQAVVVENRPGAGGMIGTESASRAKPDGYTLIMGNTQTIAVNPVLQKKLSYDPASLVPISLVAELPLVLLVNSTVDAATPADFIRVAKAKPGELTYGSAGTGSSTQFAAAILESATGIKLVHVPYKGGGPAMQDLMGGHVNLTFLTVFESGPALRSGKVRALAVTSATRSPALPNIPTLAETVSPGYASISWIGLMAPAATPAAVLERIARDVQDIVATAEMKQRFIEQGATPVGSSPVQFKALIESEMQRYRRIIVEKGITPAD